MDRISSEHSMSYTFWYVPLSFLLGAVPFSYWLGKYITRRDIREFGDGNPGAFNAYAAGGFGVGVLAVMLDITKAALPVGLAYQSWGVRGWEMFLIGTAPLAGHIFSPFLGFKGGKGIAAAFGVWIGISSWPVLAAAVAVVLAGRALLSQPGWAVMAAMGAILMALVLNASPVLHLAVWATQLLLLAWTHRLDLQNPPRWRKRASG